MTALEWMERFAHAYAKAFRYMDSTVWVNPAAPAAAREKLEQYGEPILFGVKDTDQIPLALVKRLAVQPDFVWMTVDRMAPHGRAIDPALTNPLTGRRMTGSSSGSALNILRGVHDLALATDGGGSILGPALATQLYGINAKGLGLKGRKPSQSTEGLPLTVGIGVLSHSLAWAKRALEALLETRLDAELTGLRVALDVDAPGKLEALFRAEGCTVHRFDKGQAYERAHGLALIRELFQSSDLIVSAEGPVDVESYADSLVMNGHPDARGGKFLLRSANLADTTAVAVPGEAVAAGYIVLAQSGLEAGRRAIAAAEAIAAACPRSALFEEYFLRRMRLGHSGFFHEGM
ncbi:amidase family protein [Alicyclobacillus macrosporangiidus]|uniref:Amidase n=1 Tax=Alicyclobacillus macrosporangiidus TaxID=392015 RepID=A0A1I7L9M4_9BACL|nr:amidase family protein [Alicyclobacillus macrosporangiidus]SFV06236.1 Amidase [Alicyclobacillus macrosporangiidus]